MIPYGHHLVPDCPDRPDRPDGGDCDLCWRPDIVLDGDDEAIARAVIDAIASGPALGRFAPAVARGCRCHACPLGPAGKNGGGPVLPELRDSAVLYVIGEAPGVNEVREGRPFVGASGDFLHRALGACGVRRYDVSLSNALLCRPRGELRAYLKALGRRNRTRAGRRRSPDHAVCKAPDWCADCRPIPSPIQCCRPRVLTEVASAKAILTLGATAYAAVTNAPVEESGFMAVRGFPQRVDLGA